MKFGLFYELQIPKPWNPGDEHRVFKEALEQIIVADRLGFDYAWSTEHHFLEEYSHASAPEVFLASAASVTKRIRLGHGIRQVIANYNHPARTAEATASLDLLSDGRVDLGIGEGATRLELGGFGVPAKEKRAMSLEAAEQIANMMVLEPYPGFEGKSFSMPCRNVIPKPLQKPHPPMWMACTNRDTIRVAASLGLGALAFSFVDPEQALYWSNVYYDTIMSDQCVPLGHTVNANIALVSAFSVHRDREEAIARGQEGFEFFGYGLNLLVAEDIVPGRTDLWGDFRKSRAEKQGRLVQAADEQGFMKAAGVGTPDDMRRHLEGFQKANVDQVIFLQQSGKNRHQHICDALELFASDVMPGFKQGAEERQKAKAEKLAPYIEAALKRKKWMQPIRTEDIPVVKASVKKAQIAAG